MSEPCAFQYAFAGRCNLQPQDFPHGRPRGHEYLAPATVDQTIIALEALQRNWGDDAEGPAQTIVLWALQYARETKALRMENDRLKAQVENVRQAIQQWLGGPAFLD